MSPKTTMTAAAALLSQQRAKRIRVIAEDVRDDKARKFLRDIARDYESLAAPKAMGR